MYSFPRSFQFIEVLVYGVTRAFGFSIASVDREKASRALAVLWLEIVISNIRGRAAELWVFNWKGCRCEQRAKVFLFFSAAFSCPFEWQWILCAVIVLQLMEIDIILASKWMNSLGVRYFLNFQNTYNFHLSRSNLFYNFVMWLHLIEFFFIIILTELKLAAMLVQSSLTCANWHLSRERWILAFKLLFKTQKGNISLYHFHLRFLSPSEISISRKFSRNLQYKSLYHQKPIFTAAAAAALSILPDTLLILQIFQANNNLVSLLSERKEKPNRAETPWMLLLLSGVSRFFFPAACA